MSTNAYIGYIEGDEYIHIYNHWDGYFSHVGKLLLNHYNDINLVKNLVSLGDISFLESNLENTVAYHRDRGEDLVIRKCLIDRISELDLSYIYVYSITHGWMYMSDGQLCKLLPEMVLK